MHHGLRAGVPIDTVHMWWAARKHTGGAVITHACVASASGPDGGEDGAEDGGAGCQAGGIDDGADRSLALGRPHGAVAVGDLALNHGWPQRPLTGVVGGLDPPRMIQEGQKLITSPADLGLKRTGQVAGTRGGENVRKLPLQGPAFR